MRRTFGSEYDNLGGAFSNGPSSPPCMYPGAKRAPPEPP